MLIFTDGACINNGQRDAPPAAGFAFVYHCGRTGAVGMRLEDKGLTGLPAPQTNNRAELRAVIAALEFRNCGADGFFDEVVIATDSEYVAKGATMWVNGWARNGWIASNGYPVKNRDLWEHLLYVVDKSWVEEGLEVLFWPIPREWNQRADWMAKDAAALPRIPHFTSWCAVSDTRSTI